MILNRTSPAFVSPDALRARFAAAVSEMYRVEVPLYGRLVDLVTEVNAAADVPSAIETGRIEGERHGAIRLGTADELRQIARAFALLGMAAVGYYDLAPVGLPVHSTAFRPVTAAAMARSPFRIFTSLLRLDRIEPVALRREAEALLANRAIFTQEAERLIARAEAAGGLDEADGARFVTALLETFRWHDEARVSAEVYAELVGSHRLVADVVGFRGPHINHLTPRVLDIDRAQDRMAASGFDPKASIEGPPRRDCPLLLRQTSFKALDEPIRFCKAGGRLQRGHHSARFGEVEQRGAALTPAGRIRYDRWLAEGGDLAQLLPDDWAGLRRERLAFFRYDAMPSATRNGTGGRASIDRLIEGGHLVATPILYEDFLPVSAAGIFRSNLGATSSSQQAIAPGDRGVLEQAIGRPLLDEMALYTAEQAASIRRAEHDLGVALIEPDEGTSVDPEP